MNSLLPTTNIAGLGISRLSQTNTLELLADWLGGDHSRRVATANVDFLHRSQSDAELRHALQTADLVTADGMPLVWWSRLLDERIPERVTGSDLLAPLVARCAQDRRSVYFLGGLPGAAHDTAQLLQSRHPSLRVAGINQDRIDLDEPTSVAAVVDKVREAAPDLLLVALGCPKQDLFLQRHLAATGAKVGIGVGASFDFLSGRVRRAPGFLGKVGLEWLFRACTDPKRLGMRYLQNIPFALRTTLELARGRRIPAAVSKEAIL